MSIWEPHCVGFVPSPDTPTIHEQWVAGTYLVAGVFPIVTEGVTPRRLVEVIPELLTQTRNGKRAAWPRGICAYYLIPVYCSAGFSDETIDWVTRRPKYRWAIWHEPVLFCTRTNEAVCFDARGLWCAAFRPFLSAVISRTLFVLSQRFGIEEPPRVKGNRVKDAQPAARANAAQRP